jgi:hypothetical protein
MNNTRLKCYSEPCIRGHRSSKCQHFDRLMMKVPKAGRPLAKCPHPKGTCSCQKSYAVMVRIPKGTSMSSDFVACDFFVLTCPRLILPVSPTLSSPYGFQRIYSVSCAFYDFDIVASSRQSSKVRQETKHHASSAREHCKSNRKYA